MGAEYEEEGMREGTVDERGATADGEWIKAEGEGSITELPAEGRDQDGGVMQAASAQEAWSFYREQHPLRLDDCEP